MFHFSLIIPLSSSNIPLIATVIFFSFICHLLREAIHVPFMAKFVVFAKRTDPLEARLRVFCMTDDREDKTLEHQEQYTEVAKSRDVEVLEDKIQYIELAGNLVPVTKSGEQLKLPFKAFRENRLPFAVRVKDQHADIVGRALFMREPKIAKGEPPQQPICILNIVLPENIIPEQSVLLDQDMQIRHDASVLMRSPDTYCRLSDLRIVDLSNLLAEDWIKLAPEIGISQTDIDVILAQNPHSTAKQAQALLTLFQNKDNSDINILENGLRVIHRDDIVDQCIRIKTSIISTTTTTTTTTKRIPGYSAVATKTSSLDLGGTVGLDEQDLMKDSESLEELVQLDEVRHRELKYSVEEKIVEKSESEEEEDTVAKTVAERRQQIQKRLSTERTAPSTQKKEIQEEIVEIKRRSLIEETKSKHEEEILMQKPIDNTYKTGSGLPEQVVKLKTSTSKDGPLVSKTDFEQELQDKFKTTLKDVDQFEHVPQAVYQSSTESDHEKREVYDIGQQSLIDIKDTTKKSFDSRTFTSEESTESTTTTSNGLESVVTKSTIKTITTGEPPFTIKTETPQFYDQEKRDSSQFEKSESERSETEFRSSTFTTQEFLDRESLFAMSEKTTTTISSKVTEAVTQPIPAQRSSIDTKVDVDLLKLTEQESVSSQEEREQVQKFIESEARWDTAPVVAPRKASKPGSRDSYTEETYVTEEEIEVKDDVIAPEIKQLDEVIKQEVVKVEKKLEEKFDEITKGSQLITPAGK